MQPTADGGYILGGFSPSGISGSKTQASFGGIDYWVVKLDATGVKQWDKTFGGSNDDKLSSLHQTADGGYIIGGQSNSGASGSKTQSGMGGFDLWVLKLDATGTKVWDKTFGSGANERLASVHQTADGGYAVAAETGSGIEGDRSEAGQGALDYWLLKLDTTGTKVWDHSLGGSNNDILNAMQPTADGGYLLGGFSYSGASGDKSQGTRGNADYDFWVVKVDSAGAKQWDATLGGAGFDNLTSVVQANGGGYLVGGFSNSPVSGEKTQGVRGDFDNWIVKLSPTGTKVWDKTFGGDGYDSLNGLQQTDDQGYIFGSQSNSGVNGEKTQANMGPNNTPDYWVVKVDSMGVKQWDGTYGGAQDEVLTSLKQTADGGVILGGFSSSGVSGTRSQASEGSFDYWVVKLSDVVISATSATANHSKLNLYPNPAARNLTVQLPAQAPRAGLQLQLVDANGRMVWQQTTSSLATGDISIHLPGLSAGLYLLRINGPEGYSQAQRLTLE
ncbi:T9SS type A sorting domain-containing protein [Hymenobacter sp. ASUV-10]|uniref:T9SS type A sorting domain-containing protein n=1 Tax=Hymenobacter aranciens TaxID=3063996 RepID=A0ABT9B8A0_9BACT|nr:T9SS type A sorting domain-containing protein [Hymenobacter sp. ASUV-10]MDO7874507.1 T9SS type A sorting domain-containing protein [Hymenobacter sp. ASUV-10]